MDDKININKYISSVSFVASWHIFYFQYRVPSQDILTTIHTWAHLALTSNTKAGWTNNSETQMACVL